MILTFSDRCTELLLSSGASVEIEDNFHEVPILTAARYDQAKVVELLFPYYTDPLSYHETNLRNVLHLAVMFGSIDIVKIICNHIRVTNHVTECIIKDKTLTGSVHGCTCPVHYPLIEQEDVLGYTALHVGVQFNRPEAVSFLLQCSKSLADTPFTRKRISPDRLVQRKASYWDRPLHYAIKQATALGQMYKILVDGGADLNLPDSNGKTPLWYANEHKELEAMAFLRSHGAKMFLKTSKTKL